jgi:hypothetical protein
LPASPAWLTPVPTCPTSRQFPASWCRSSSPPATRQTRSRRWWSTARREPTRQYGTGWPRISRRRLVQNIYLGRRRSFPEGPCAPRGRAAHGGYGLGYPLGALMALCIAARSTWRGERKVEWRGRTYGSRPELLRPPLSSRPAGPPPGSAPGSVRRAPGRPERRGGGTPPFRSPREASRCPWSRPSPPLSAHRRG